jgi:hypothetical protein
MEAPTRTPTAATDTPRLVRARPRLGVLGIMQQLYDAMLPGITERPHHQVLNFGHRLEEWRLFCEALAIEVVAV